MRFISMHKVNADTEAGRMPGMDVIEGMGKLMGEMGAAGLIRGGDGLLPSSRRVRVTRSGGAETLTKGPLVGGNELVASIVMVRVATMEDAVAWGRRLAAAYGDGEVEVGPVTEGWDLGVMPKPPDAPVRALLLRKATASTESGAAPAADEKQRVEAVLGEMRTADVLVQTQGLTPSSQGRRLRYKRGHRTVVDGPFAESKELISGYVVLEAPTMDVLWPWLDRFVAVIGDVELDVRPLPEEA